MTTKQQIYPIPDLDLPDWLRAGFTTRHGGVSTGQWASFNLGLHVGDVQPHVRTNRAVLEDELGSRVIWMNQVHGVQVADARSARDNLGDLHVGNADAILLERTDVVERLAIAVMVADCIPLLIFDLTDQRGAVVHVGRAGLVGGIAPRVVAKLLERGSSPHSLRAVIGPHICGSCYEVNQAIADDVALTAPAARSTSRWGTPAVDIGAGLKEQLRQAGIAVYDVGVCTYESADFFSHRRATHAGQTTGRFIGFISMDSPGNTPTK